MKMYRRLLLGAATVALGILLFGMTVFAETTGTIIPASAKIRAEANTSSTVIASVTSGKTISITDEVTGDDGSTWYQVYVDAATKGFIRSDLVQKSDSTDTAQTTTTSTDTQSTTSVTTVDSQSCKVSVTSAKVRKNASTSSDVVASVSKGTVLTVTGKATGDDGKEWYQISFTYNNQSYTGFIRSDLVTFGELEEEEPAVTEVEGTTASDTDETATEEGQAAVDGEASEGTVSSDAVAEEGTTETTEQQSQTSASDMTILTTEETPPLPAGFTEVAVTLNDQAVRAWKNGDFYIFYAQSASGGEGFYMYDSAEVTYQRYFMSNVLAQEETNSDGSIFKTLVIVLAVVIVLLLVLVTILAIKMNDYRSELEWDDDDEEDEEEEDDEEVEDEEEDEEEEDVRPVRKSRLVKKAPSVQSELKPRNFLEVEEDLGHKTVKKQDYTNSAVSDEFDPDDEDTFVFINLDGDEID